MNEINRLSVVAPDVWAVRRVAQSLDEQGRPMEFTSRLTIVRLTNGKLFLHSPVALDPSLEAELERLGTIDFLVAPSLWHDLFIKDYVAAYPEAQAFSAPGLQEARPDVAFYGTLSDDRALVRGEIAHVVVHGHVANEVVFFHRASRSLIVSDLAYNVREDCTEWERTWAREQEGYGSFALMKYHRGYVNDPDATRASLRRILEWDFDRVIVGHGHVLEQGGKEAFKRIWSWLLF
jgi:glyoxylase-like metal-dependent hydrolase (beta-lactamase superfamily II)